LQGANDPYWVHDFFLDNLCARRAILRIKIDKYNLEPIYNRRFTVSKYLGEDIPPGNDHNAEPVARSSANTLSNDLAGDENDEEREMLAKVTDDEWAMADESLWGPTNPLVTTITTTSSVMVITIRQ
jgi:hypothetical protein